MAGNIYQNGLWVSQGDVELVNEEVTEVGVAAAAGATKQFAAGQVGKKFNIPDPSNSGSLLPKEYRYVLRSESTQLIGPHVVQWADPTDGLYGFESADGTLPIAGVFLGDDTADVGQRGVQDGNYGFIQCGGHVQLVCGGTTTAGADQTSPSGGTVVDRTLFTEPLVGVALESGTTGDSVWCLLSLITID